MSIASEITRITQLRNRIRNKLIALGEIDNPNADLFYCTVAIENMTPRGRFVLDMQSDTSQSAALSHDCTFNISVDSLENVKTINIYSSAYYSMYFKIIQFTTVNTLNNWGTSGTIEGTMTYFDGEGEIAYSDNISVSYSIDTSGRNSQITFTSTNYFNVGGTTYLQYGYVIPGEFDDNDSE